jgi:regulatory protein
VSANAGRRRRAQGSHLDGPTPESAADQAEPADPASVARSLLLRKLTNAPATRSQLAELLASRGIPDDVAVAVLDRYEEVGLIDDSSFAALWVESRQRGRGLARRALRQELTQRGISNEVVDASLSAITVEDERAAARALVMSKLRSTSRLERQARVRRLVGMLARRGYSSGMAMSVVLEALGDDQAVDDWVS